MPIHASWLHPIEPRICCAARARGLSRRWRRAPHWGPLEPRGWGYSRTKDLGEPGGRVAAQRLAVPEARYFGIERGEVLGGCGGGRWIGVEYPEHRLAIVGGQRVAGDEHPLLLKPCSHMARRVTRRAHNHRVVLPASVPIAVG